MDYSAINNFLQNVPSWQLNTIFTVLAIWSIAWKGFALYHASRHEEKFWFITLLVINTIGLLEIAYIFFISADKIVVDDLKTYLDKANDIKSKKLASFRSKNKKKS